MKQAGVSAEDGEGDEPAVDAGGFDEGIEGRIEEAALPVPGEDVIAVRDVAGHRDGQRRDEGALLRRERRSDFPVR